MQKENFIKIKNARVHNLKNISLNIPKHKLVVVTGVSGSGKTSLVFDTIFNEAQREYLESISSYARNQMKKIAKADVDEIESLSPVIAVNQKALGKNPPKLIIFSAGKCNPFHYSNSSVITLVKKLKISYLITYNTRTVKGIFDGENEFWF